MTSQFFKKNRKGQSNMFWIIIGAVIALVVMIVLLLIFTGKTSALNEGVSGCEGKSGQCYASTSCPSGTLKAPFDCAIPSDICCIGFESNSADANN